MTLMQVIWLVLLLFATIAIYKTLRFPLFSYENVNSTTLNADVLSH